MLSSGSGSLTKKEIMTQSSTQTKVNLGLEIDLRTKSCLAVYFVSMNLFSIRAFLLKHPVVSQLFQMV